jgi:hypothetical protein
MSVAEPDNNNRQGRTRKSGFEAPRNSLDLDADNPNDIDPSRPPLLASWLLDLLHTDYFFLTNCSVT